VTRPWVQEPLFARKAEWRPTPVVDLPDWPTDGRVAVDCETCDPQLRKMGPGVRRDGFIAGTAFAIDGGPTYYLPTRHLLGDNLPLEEVQRYLRAQAARFRGDLCGANLPYDLDYLAEDGVAFGGEVRHRDVQVSAPLLYELHSNYSLESIAQRAGLAGKDETLLVAAARDRGLDPKAELWKLPARFVGAYAEQDTRLPLEILRLHEPEIDRQGLRRVYDLESAVLPVLLKMRRRGVRIDFDQLDKIEAWSLATERLALDEIKRVTGLRLAPGEIASTGPLAPVLRAIGVVLPKTEKTLKDRIDVEVLDAINHPLAAKIKLARKVVKLRTTFISGVRRYATNGRLHTTFNQLRSQKDYEADGAGGAAYGRLSSVNPNLQNQPAREDFPIPWRSIYLPEEGAYWSSPDFSSQEPRLFVHLAIERGRQMLGDAAFESAKALAARYHSDPDMDFHRETAAATHNRVPRKDAKTIGLGLAYGMGEAQLCASIKLPTSFAVWDSKNKCKVYADEDKVRFDALCQERSQQMAARGEQGSPCWPAAGKEGREVLQRFDEGVPFLKKLAKLYSSRAEEMGAVRTISGRLCHFPQSRGKGRGKYEFTHKGFNRAVQGSAGCQTKQALVDMDRAGLHIMLQIHDEVPVSVADLEEAKRAAQVMEQAWPLHVPSRVDYSIGKNWAEAK